MSLQPKQALAGEIETNNEARKTNGDVFSKDYVDFVPAGAFWKLEI